MTGTAGADDLQVVDRICGRPRNVIVAGFAPLRRRYMCWSFPGRSKAIMAADAIAGDVGVVEIGGQPRSRRMAVVTVVAATDVRLVLAGGDGAVVATAARADDLRMIDRESRYPSGCAVTVFAEIR